jgi:hypothetical protein
LRQLSFGSRTNAILACVSSQYVTAIYLPNGVEDGKETRLEGVFEHSALIFFLNVDLFKIIFELKLPL